MVVNLLQLAVMTMIIVLMMPVIVLLDVFIRMYHATITTNVQQNLAIHLVVANITLYPQMTTMLVLMTFVKRTKVFIIWTEIVMITICVQKIPVTRLPDAITKMLFVMIMMLVLLMFVILQLDAHMMNP